MTSYLIKGSELCNLGVFAALFGTSFYITCQTVKHIYTPCPYETYSIMLDRLAPISIVGVCVAATFATGCMFLEEVDSSLRKIF